MLNGVEMDITLSLSLNADSREIGTHCNDVGIFLITERPHQTPPLRRGQRRKLTNTGNIPLEAETSIV